MLVEDIIEISKIKFKVVLEDGIKLTLYKGEIKKYRIETGIDLSEEIYNEIEHTVLLKRAKKRALHLLEQMPRTEVQLRKKLEQNGYSQGNVEEAITYVKSFGYINDSIYAESYVRAHYDRKSRRELMFQLREKGIKEEDIIHALDHIIAEQGESSAVQRAIRRRGIDLDNISEEQKTKLYGYLARKGFTYEEIKSVLECVQEYGI